MGPSISVNRTSSDVQQSVRNNIVQNQTSACNYTCSQTADNNTVIISGDRIHGNIDAFTFKCTTDIACNLANSTTANTSSILSATVKQKNTPSSGGFGFSLHISADSDSSQYITATNNNITQITQATCQATTTQDASNNFFVVANSEVGGNVALINATGNTSGNCTIQNIANATSYNNDQANVDQENLDMGIFSMIIIGIIILAIIGGLVAIFSNGFNAINHKDKDNLSTEQINEISSELAGAPVPSTGKSTSTISAA